MLVRSPVSSRSIDNLKCAAFPGHAVAIEAVLVLVWAQRVISTAIILKGCFIEQSEVVFSPPIQQYAWFCCCLLVAGRLWPHHQQGPEEAEGHPKHTPAHLHFTPQLPLHNPCITTAGSNAFPSSAAALDLPSQFIFPLNCAQLSGPRRAQPRAEPSCHAGLSAPNPGLAALPAGLVKKQMAVTDPPCDCGQLIAQDNSEIRT